MAIKRPMELQKVKRWQWVRKDQEEREEPAK